ncbi:MAG: hypothetical protein RJQ09_18960 [Cyclobacteriaceae bacterium]
MSTSEVLPKTEIKEHKITIQEPLRVDYQIAVTADQSRVYLDIPDIGYRISFERDLVVHPATKVRIHGFCNPINPEFGASLEEFMDVKDIKIQE